MILENKEKDEALKAFIVANKHLQARLGGSLALKLHGLDPCRKPKDVDVIVSNLLVSTPEGFVVIEKANAIRMSDNENCTVRHPATGLILDVLEKSSFDTKFKVVEGIPLENPYAVLKAKLEYVFKPWLSDEVRKKHVGDISVILPQINNSRLTPTDIPKVTEPADENWDLPF